MDEEKTMQELIHELLLMDEDVIDAHRRKVIELLLSEDEET